VLLCELLDGAGNRMSGRCVQRRPGPWPGLDSALPCGVPSAAAALGCSCGVPSAAAALGCSCGFPSVARNAPLATFAAAARFRPECWWRS